MTATEQLRDRILRRAVLQAKVENGTLKDVLQRWRQLGQTIQSLIAHAGLAANSDTLNPGTSPAVRRLLSDIWGVMAYAVDGITRSVRKDLEDFIRHEVATLPHQLDQVVNAPAFYEAEDDFATTLGRLSVLFSLVPYEQIAQLLASPAGGSVQQQAFLDMQAETFRSVRNALTYGLLQGDDTRTVARRVRTIMTNRRYQAERIVRTEYNRAATQAALLTYQQNERLLRGVQWLSTLDARTCIQCGVLDGRFFASINEAWQPPLHPNCRCVLIPVLRNARELGLVTTPTTRASFTGQVPATLSYPEWFAQQDADFQRDVLGPTRFKLYQNGDYMLKDFVTPSGIKKISEL